MDQCFVNVLLLDTVPSVDSTCSVSNLNVWSIGDISTVYIAEKWPIICLRCLYWEYSGIHTRRNRFRGFRSVVSCVFY